MTTNNHNLARLRDRIISFLIDQFSVILVLRISLALCYSSAKITQFQGFFGVFIALLYMFSADGLMHGQSFGKRIMEIYVIDAKSGRPCTFIQSLIRNSSLLLLGLIDCMFIFSEKQQRLGDKIAKTIVIKKTS